MTQRWLATTIVGLALLAGGSVTSRLAAQGLVPEACQTFVAINGAPEDIAAIKDLIRRLQDAYRGSTKSTMRFLREFDQTRFVSGFSDLERDLERDFEFLQNRELLCRRGQLQFQDDVAVFQGEWEKMAFVGRRFIRIEQKGTQRMQLMREDRATGPVWRVTGLAGERIFGQTGDIRDVAVTAFPLPSTLPSARGVALSATIENLGPAPITTPIVVAFYDATPGGAAVQVGQQVLPGLPAGGRTTAAVRANLPTVGRRTLLVIVDPDNRIQEIDETNNRLAQSVTVGADAVLVILPNPNPVRFPDDPLTIRVTDPDMAGAKSVKVKLVRSFQSIAAPGGLNSPLHTAVDEEEFVIEETRTPGVFERQSIPTGSFFCGNFGGIPATGFILTPTKNNGRLEFPRSPAPISSGCFDADLNPLVRNTVVGTYIEPFDANGRPNVERRVTVIFTHPAVP